MSSKAQSPEVSTTSGFSQPGNVSLTPAEIEARTQVRRLRRLKRREEKKKNKKLGNQTEHDLSSSHHAHNPPSPPNRHDQHSPGSKADEPPCMLTRETGLEADNKQRTISTNGHAERRKRERSHSPPRTKSVSRAHSKLCDYRAEASESPSALDSTRAGHLRESGTGQRQRKRVKREEDLESAVILTFHDRSSAAQFERIIDSVPSLAAAKEQIRTKFRLGSDAAFHLSSESLNGRSVVLEDEEDFRAFKLRALRSTTTSAVVNVQPIPAGSPLGGNRTLESTSSASVHDKMLSPLIRQSAAQAASRAPPMASTPIAASTKGAAEGSSKKRRRRKASKSRTEDLADESADSTILQASALPAVPIPDRTAVIQRTGFPAVQSMGAAHVDTQATPKETTSAKDALQRAESNVPRPDPVPNNALAGKYIPPSLRAKYGSSSEASTSSVVEPPVQAQTRSQPPSGTSINPTMATTTVMPLVLPPPPVSTPLDKPKVKSAHKGPSADEKWVEERIAAGKPCGICEASPFHSCRDCPALIAGGLLFAEKRCDQLGVRLRKQAWHKAAIKDLESVIFNTRAAIASSEAGGGNSSAASRIDSAALHDAHAPETSSATTSAPATAVLPDRLSSLSIPSQASPADRNPESGSQDELAATQALGPSQVLPPNSNGSAPAANAIVASNAGDETDVSPVASADQSPPDKRTAPSKRSQTIIANKAMKEMQEREAKWIKIRKDYAAAQQKVNDFLAREAQGSGLAKGTLKRSQTILRKKTAELEEMESEMSDFSNRMKVQRPPRAPELDAALAVDQADAAKPVSSQVSKSKSSNRRTGGTEAPSAAPALSSEDRGSADEVVQDNEPACETAVSPGKTKRKVGRPRQLETEGATRPADGARVIPTSQRRASSLARAIDGSADHAAAHVTGEKKRVGLRTPLSEHSEDDVETSPILQSIPSQQDTERIDEQPLPPPLLRASATGPTNEPNGTTIISDAEDREHDADDEEESARERVSATPRSPHKEFRRSDGTVTAPLPLEVKSPSKVAGRALSQSGASPPPDDLSLPEPSQAPKKRQPRSPLPHLASSSSSGSDTSDDSDQEEQQAEDEEPQAEETSESGAELAESEQASESEGNQEEGGFDEGSLDPDGKSSQAEEEDEIEASQRSRAALDGRGSPASSHTRSRSSSIALSSEGQNEAEGEEDSVASSPSHLAAPDEADPISTFSKPAASPEPTQDSVASQVPAPRSSGIFSSFNFFQSNRPSQGLAANKVPPSSQLNGTQGHSASQPTPTRRPKLSMPRLSELDASQLLRRRQQPSVEGSVSSSQPNTPIAATGGRSSNSGAVMPKDRATTEADDDEGADDDDDEGGSGSESSSSSSSSEWGQSGKAKESKRGSPQKKQGNAGKAVAGKGTVLPASKRAGAVLPAKKKRKGLADLF